jgi:glycosyltransferase involved in cell wall biosynthesis
MPIRVLHLIESLGVGGAERLLYSILKHLDRTRFESIVCPLYTTEDHWGSAIRGLGYLVKSPELKGRWNWRRGVIGLRELVRADNIDLIHSHLYDANFYGRLLGRNLHIPIVTSLHNPDYNPEILKDDPRLNRVKLCLSCMLDKWTSHLWGGRWIAVSEYVKADAIQRISLPPEKIDVVYNGVEVKLFSNAGEGPRARLRAALGIKEDEPILLTLGRLHPQKGQLYMIQALPKILAAYPTTRLLIVGSGSACFQSALQAKAESLGIARNTFFLGIRRDVVDLLAACDLFVFPSILEGMGLALVEAMAAGRACVASRVGPIPEVVEEGETGLLVEPRNPEGLAAAVVELLSDPGRRSRMGRRAQERARRLFDIETCVQRLQNVYTKTLDEWFSLPRRLY